jgi:hypothetical protein
MKCPVCEGVIENTAQQCPKCGFSDLRTEFINDDELAMWRTYVVYPCRFAYQTSVTHIKELERKYKTELTALKNGQTEKRESERDGNDMREFIQMLALTQNPGWVAEKNITHEDSYECYNGGWAACEISNIVPTIHKNQIIVDFLVKKIFDYKGADSKTLIQFRWYLEDDCGNTVAEGNWWKEKMQVGDVTKESISISGTDPFGKYVLNFV